MEKISSTLASLRKEYGNKELDVNELSKNPINQFKKWLDEAIKIEANEPNAMAISTVTDENKPRSRYVLFKNLIEEEIIFHSHYESPKAIEIFNNPNISGIFYWPEIHRQIRFEGVSKKASPEVSDDSVSSAGAVSTVNIVVEPEVSIFNILNDFPLLGSSSPSAP